MGRIKFLSLLAGFLLFNSFLQEGEKPRIDTPQAGETIHGTVIIAGNTDIGNFQSAEVSFAYEGSDTWFPIGLFEQPVKNGPIAAWDTTEIMDGVYKLRVRVKLREGQPSEIIVGNLTVANNTAVEPTPGTISVEAATPTRLQVSQNTRTYPTATAMPQNPAEATPRTLNRVLIYSGLGGLVLIGLVLVYQLLQSKKR